MTWPTPNATAAEAEEQVEAAEEARDAAAKALDG